MDAWDAEQSWPNYFSKLFGICSQIKNLVRKNVLAWHAAVYSV